MTVNPVSGIGSAPAVPVDNLSVVRGAAVAETPSTFWSVVAQTAMAADGLSTAAMVLGRERGLSFLETQAVGGLFIAPDGAQTSVNL